MSIDLEAEYFMDVDAIAERMLNAYQFTKQKQLTSQLGIAHTAIASWRRRSNVAKSALLQCSAETGYSIEYLVPGQGKAMAKLTQNEFRFVFERIINNAKMAGILKEGEAYSNEKMLQLSDNIYQSLMNDEVFESLFEDLENKKQQIEKT